ncbi:MAG: methylmalonyl Co-A mutase-associated GTPase MeaB [Candidatus Electryonea clarkiae]|nr:methylmalonyl Co-A mutase-associated GTPase MeaB [Candidatus Electryonea clarkiae]MDP8286405.1 methylmalonyl Co-A mutase-associated GTPase MeaB [Candidatus Electryonea clarkiae]
MLSTDTLLKEFRKGNPLALARLLTRVENRKPDIPSLLDELYPSTGKAWRIGFTGPPGAGKSTIVNRMVQEYRRKDHQVGVVAFDPTSPFTGGSLLGDRVRMATISLDPGVFIRSMATRGNLGGLAVGVDEACDLMDAFGKRRILIETVGVGQSELEVAHSADTTIVVLVPQSGDAIQAMKAGLMEIADIFVMNKCDREDADRAYRELISVLGMKHPDDGWQPQVIKTIAETGDGIEKLVETVRDHRKFLGDNEKLEQRRKKRVAEKTKRLVEDTFNSRFWQGKREERRLKGLDGAHSPYELAEKLVEDFYREIRDEKTG